jgi:flagellar biosynthesis/type III secretory pathway chaperone
MAAHVTIDSSSLIDLLSQQRDLYGQLQSLTEPQTTFIEDGQTVQLLSVLSKKQGLIDRLREITEQLAPFLQSRDRIYAALTEGDLQKFRGLLKDIETRLADILERDGKAQMQLHAAQEAIDVQLTEVSRTGQAMHAYHGGTSGSESRFTDHRG